MKYRTYETGWTERWKKAWAKVWLKCEKAHLVAYDGCHKIYLAMDEGQANDFIKSKYTTFVGTPEEMGKQVLQWFHASECGLAFVCAVKSGKKSGQKRGQKSKPTEVYTQVIKQFEF